MASRDRGRPGGRFLGRILGVIVVLSVTWWLMLHAGDTLVVSRELHDPQALLMLGSHEWERLPALAQLAERNPAAVVLLTEPTKPTPGNCFRCSERIAWLAHLGVDRRRVEMLPRRVTNTYDEAAAALDYCRHWRIAKLMIVTSPYHTRRALATFDSMFQNTTTAVWILPAGSQSRATPDRWWMVSDDRAYVGYEWTALAWYAVRHGVRPFVSVE
jgi:uncharacterized SAM-binding protein YcdF (DUF218 family)